MLTREGAHSHNRILHANGDATGAEIGRSLLAHARAQKNITLLEWTTTADLIVEGGTVAGAVLLGVWGISCCSARAVLLASGGAGQVYSDTTNPAVATGDGIAMAWRADAEISDMEFYQFHPTALSLPGVSRFLLSEALRGEVRVFAMRAANGLWARYHRLLELAPRAMCGGEGDYTLKGAGTDGTQLPVYLDMRHVTRIDPHKRFPGISGFLAQHGLELSRDLIPVRPAAHYLMGGVRADVDGRTSLPRLYAAGEVACTGVHGANRLASNSLLEGLVFGARAASVMRESDALPAGGAKAARKFAASPAAEYSRFAEGIAAADLGRMPVCCAMPLACWRCRRNWSGCAVVPAAERASLELANLHAVAELITRFLLWHARRAGGRTTGMIFQSATMRILRSTRWCRGRSVSFEGCAAGSSGAVKRLAKAKTASTRTIKASDQVTGNLNPSGSAAFWLLQRRESGPVHAAGAGGRARSIARLGERRPRSTKMFDV